MLSEAGHFLLFLLKEINSVTGYPLLCFHVIRGREKTKRGLYMKNGEEAICKLERNLYTLLRLIPGPVLP